MVPTGMQFTILVHVCQWKAAYSGIYSGLLAIHLACHATKRETDSSKPNLIFYALCALYVLTVAFFAVDIADSVVLPSSGNIILFYGLGVTASVLFACCDFIAQCILIHRCWIVWGQNTRVIIVPSILAFAYLVMWVAVNGALVVVPNEGVSESAWGNRLVLTSLVASMTVNALVTGLIVFKIFKAFRRVNSVTTSAEKSLGIAGGTKLRSLIFVIIESGMVLFAVQLARVVITTTQPPTVTDPAYYAYEFILAIHEMVNGIAPTVILVRVSLGLSFHDKESLDEAVGSLQFAANPIPESGSIDQDSDSHIGHDDDLNSVTGNINQERRDDEIGGSDDIQILDR